MVGEAGVGVVAPMVASRTAASTRPHGIVRDALPPRGAVAAYTAIVPGEGVRHGREASNRRKRKRDDRLRFARVE